MRTRWRVLSARVCHRDRTAVPWPVCSMQETTIFAVCGEIRSPSHIIENQSMPADFSHSSRRVLVGDSVFEQLYVEPADRNHRHPRPARHLDAELAVGKRRINRNFGCECNSCPRECLQRSDRRVEIRHAVACVIKSSEPRKCSWTLYRVSVIETGISVREISWRIGPFLQLKQSSPWGAKVDPLVPLDWPIRREDYEA